MESTERVPCPYCRELILPGAIKCKECGSNLRSSGRTWMQTSPRNWARNQADRKLLGVASCIACNLRVSPTLVRLIFVLLTFVSLLGLFLYLALAMIIPSAPGERSTFETLVDMMGAAVDNMRHPNARTVAAVGPETHAAAETCAPAATHVPAPPPVTVTAEPSAVPPAQGNAPAPGL